MAQVYLAHLYAIIKVSEIKEMPRKKLLRGVAAGLVSIFVSRNNDIDGYWGMGVLYKFVKDSEKIVLRSIL